MIKVAGLTIDWQADFSGFAEDFGVESAENPVIKISFCKNLPECHGISYIDRPFEHFLKTDLGGVLVANSDWSGVTSYGYRENDRDFALPLAAVCSRFSYYNALLAHASLVSCNGEGVLFTGYSGAGKTTQAELWQRYLGAEIINGDKVFLRDIGGNFYGCGLPWRGSSAYCLNKNVPLKAIVVLSKAKENRISELSDVTERIMPHIFFPHWAKDCLNNALDTFDSLIKSVPVYSLECRPDNEAVNLTFNTIFG